MMQSSTWTTEAGGPAGGRVGFIILSVSEQTEAAAHSHWLLQTVTSFSYVMSSSYVFIYLFGEGAASGITACVLTPTGHPIFRTTPRVFLLKTVQFTQITTTQCSNTKTVDIKKSLVNIK